jgi:GGDEF domain-containing protein
MARKIGSALVPPFGAAAMGLHVTSSIGVAFVDRTDVSANEVMAQADNALHRAKRAGRATFAVATLSGEASARKAS